MYRKESKTIQKWLDTTKKALLVTGARQTGKTWLIRDEIKKSSYRLFEINFIDQPDMVNYFSTNMSAEDFLIRLRMIMPDDCRPHETVVFFDEIQKCPQIVTKIKFLVDEGSFKYIMSGSLLGLELKGISSVPVGYLRILRMYPMDFEEFMIACGISRITIDKLAEKFDSLNPVEEYMHDRVLSLFYIYLIVGGMPEAVLKYVETKDLREVQSIQNDITELYKEDFSQYEQEDKKLKIKSIYEIIPSELNKQNKRFIFTMLDKELKFDRYENSFLWLKDAGVALPVYNVEAPVIPLITSKSTNVFKLFSSDTGLLTSCYPLSTKIELINKNGDVNNGAHFENAVVQQLTANGFTPYYCKKKKTGELDFLIEMNGRAVPVEVKSGSDYKDHAALDNYMAVKDYHLNQAFVLCNGNIEKQNNIIYLPVYMTYLIKEKEADSMMVDVDLSDL